MKQQKVRKEPKIFYNLEQLHSISDTSNLSEFEIEVLTYIKDHTYDEITSYLVEQFEANKLPYDRVGQLQEYMGIYYTGFVQKVKI